MGIKHFNFQVELPKQEPNFNSPFIGFTETTEIWNSRACMIGLIGTFIVELILNKGILQIIGVDLGKVLIFLHQK
ncbi:light-harvesting complex OHP1, chloroplastic, partial [Olea europaea subsp. europaea]